MSTSTKYFEESTISKVYKKYWYKKTCGMLKIKWNGHLTRPYEKSLSYLN